MNSFQFKELTVTLDTTQIYRTFCLNPTYYCHFPSNYCHGCTLHITQIPCFHNTVIGCGITDITIWKTTTPVQGEIERFDDLELKQFREELGNLQKTVDEKIQQVPAELDKLEGKLNSAIEEIRVRKNSAATGKQ